MRHCLFKQNDKETFLGHTFFLPVDSNIRLAPSTYGNDGFTFSIYLIIVSCRFSFSLIADRWGNREGENKKKVSTLFSLRAYNFPKLERT